MTIARHRIIDPSVTRTITALTGASAEASCWASTIPLDATTITVNHG